jgi:predicted DsbA family dithiol-disulfide isomerase
MQLTLDTLHKNLGGLIKHYFKPRPIYDDKIRQLRSRAVLAAKQQGKYWEMKHELFSIDIDQENRGNKKFLKEAIFEKARDIGLDINKFRKDLNSRAIRKELRSITDEADTYGITTVPTLFINGTMIVGYHSFNYYLDVIVQKLNQKQQAHLRYGRPDRETDLR